jgi:integrase
MVYPRRHKENSTTKRSWISFYNQEAEAVLETYLDSRKDDDKRVFSLSVGSSFKTWKKASKKTGINIMPKVLRDWFCCEMGSLSVPDRYVDAFCGRTPKSVLAKHYTDYSPDKLKKIYEKAGLIVLSA